MVRATRVGVVARFEFVETVRKPSFLFATFGLPLLLLAVTVLSTAAQAEWIREATGGRDRVAIVAEDPGALAADARFDPGVVRYPDERAALRALAERRVDAIVVLERSWLETGAARQIARGDVQVLVRDDAGPRLAAAASLRRILAQGVTGPEDPRVERLVRPLDIRLERLGRDGTVRAAPSEMVEAYSTVLLPMLLAAMLTSALLMASGYLVQAVALDKETRMIEVLVSSCTPEELLAGKLLGLGGAGLVQFVVFSVLSGGAGVLLAARVAGLEAPPPLALALLPPAFLLGYAFLGALVLALGAFGTSVAEAQKLTVGVVFLAIVPLFVFPLLLEAPAGALARVLTFVPFTAPITLVLRASLAEGGIAPLEALGALVVLAVATAFALRVAAAAFRVGLLVSGALPSPREVFRAMRSGG